MKNGIMMLMVLINFYATSQTPQTIYGVVKDRQEMSWYQEQELLWKKEVDANKKNPVAWLNYYEAVRAQYLLSEEGTEVLEAFVERLDEITENLYDVLPNTFEANYLMYRNFGRRDKGDYFKYLERAFEIDPNDSRVYDLFITQYERDRNKSGFHDFCVRYFKANELPSGVYNWAYNMLSELDENAILFTGGDLDTYPMWALQEAKNIRTDVQIINTSLILEDEYRIKLLKEIGLPAFEKKHADCKSEEEQSTFLKELFEHIFKNEQGIPVYVAGNIIFQFEEHFGENLYMTGLTYKYSAETIDNLSLLRRNYEKRYLLDYLTASFSFHPGDKMVTRVNATYLNPFIKLYLHYQDGEETEKLIVLRSYIESISKAAGSYDEVIQLIGS